MIDLTTPPFAAGDLAYGAPAPGGFATAGAVPTDPAFGGVDAAFVCPSLGGDFQPGSGKAAPTASPIAKGSDADGGAADIDTADTGTPPPNPAAPPALSVEVLGMSFAYSGKATAAKTVTVTYKADGVGTAKTFTVAIPINTLPVAAADLSETAAKATAELDAVSNNNGVTLLADPGHTLDQLVSVVIT